MKKNKKNKNLSYEVDESKDNIFNGTAIIFGILVVCFLISLIALISEGDYRFGKKEKEISYDEIIAGETFNRSEEEYYVVFYKASDDQNILSTISSLTTTKKIYKVDLDNGFNKQILGKENKKANSAKDLKVTNPTVIKIVNNKNAEYVSGKEKVVEYLNKI